MSKESARERFSISSVLPARTDEMFGEASSDLTGFGEAGTLRLADVVGGGYVLEFGTDVGALAEGVAPDCFLTVQAGIFCSIGSGEVDLGMTM